MAGVAQLVECQLPKLNVAGSNPVSRSYTKAHCYADKKRTRRTHVKKSSEIPHGR